MAPVKNGARVSTRRRDRARAERMRASVYATGCQRGDRAMGAAEPGKALPRKSARPQRPRHELEHAEA